MKLSENETQRLEQLAHACGVGTQFWAFDGSQQRVKDSTLVAVLGALGIDASSPALVEVALTHLEDDAWRHPLPPTVVAREDQAIHFPVHVTEGEPVEVWIELDAEAGGGRRETHQVDHYVPPRMVDGRLTGRATFHLPHDLPLGWHELHSRSSDGHSHVTLIVTPNAISLPEQLDHGRAWGFMTQLYSVRSAQSWGVGDFADLADLAWFTGREFNADYILINPLHAAEPSVPMTPSPYLPSTRRFINPLYIRVEDIRETGYLSAADRSLIEWGADEVRSLNSDSGPIDRNASWSAKKAALEVVFEAGRSAARAAAFADFRNREGKGLEDFALWCTIKEDYPGDLEEFPAELQDPASAAVAKIRRERAARIDFFAWLQWVADEQLESAQRQARAGGMSLGIMQDLAVGVHPLGADAWALRSEIALGATVGAPPDMYNQLGQDWSQPPWHPQALARAGYKPFRDMIRAILRHSGAIRVDHVIGLFRLWWIPEGNGAQDGAYVQYDHEAMIGILCLEAARANAVVIGEDLGTFEPWVRDYLNERGILGTSILWFEKDHDGQPRQPEDYRRMTLTSVTTHDLPPTAGYLAGEHVEIRERLGLLEAPVHRVRQEAQRERDQITSLLTSRGLAGPDASERELVEALHAFIKQTPAVLLGVSLADAVGERRTQNQPGTDQEYPNWKVPLGDSAGNVVLIDDLLDNARLRSLAAVMKEA